MYSDKWQLLMDMQTPDPDVVLVRRVLAAAKQARSRKNNQLRRWKEGEFDNTPYFQAALAEFKAAKKEIIL